MAAQQERAAQIQVATGRNLMADVKLLQGDCIQTLRTLEAGSVQTCVTSPPYYGLRSYNGGDAEIGTERTVGEYIAKLVDVFREVKRVLRDDGTCWINLGDSMLPNKCEGMIPHRVAMALMEDGWICRSTIIWHKPNPMPESVTDRPTKAHEYIFLLSKSKIYFYDADAVREENSPTSGKWGKSVVTKTAHAQGDGRHGASGFMGGEISHEETIERYYTNGRNRRSVWTVTTKPYKGAHFATFPPDLIEPCILAGTSEKGCCSECGAPWARAVERSNESNWQERKRNGADSGSLANGHNASHGRGVTHDLPTRDSITTGWQPTCTCNAEVAPCTVLDPFSGSGTTGAVAVKHGRNYAGCELNPAYIALAWEHIGKAQPQLEFA